MASEKVGHGPCPQKHCTAEAFFTRSAGGKLKYACTRCDSSGYCDQGGTAHRAQMSGITPHNPPTPAPEPVKSTPAAVAADLPKKKASGLLLGA